MQHGNSRMLCGRRKRRQEPPEPYVAVNVFDTLHELVDTTGMAVAASYVKNKDFWVGIRPAQQCMHMLVNDHDVIGWYHVLIASVDVASADYRRLASS